MLGNRDTCFAHARDFVTQGTRADTEFFSRELAAAATFFQGPEYQPPFVILEVGTEGLTLVIVCTAPTRVAICDRQHHILEVQIPVFDRDALVHDERALYYVVELAHVPRPPVL